MTKNSVSLEQFHTAEVKGIRDGFGEALVALGKKQWNVVAVCADLRESIRMEKFAEQFPDRFFEVGVAEQNLVGISAGLAHEGFIPFAGSYAAFSPGRTYDQIRVSVAYQGVPVKIVGGHAGLSVGADGATHQMMEDVAMMRALPGMTVVVPSDFASAASLTAQLAQDAHPGYLRLSRIQTKNVLDPRQVKLGEMSQVMSGDDFTLIAMGTMVEKALAVAFALQESEGVAFRVLDCHTVKPLDTKAIVQAAQETKGIVTLEEHQIYGGLGSAVAEVLAQHSPARLEILGMPDSFGRSGSPEDLFAAYGLDVASLTQRVREFIRR